MASIALYCSLLTTAYCPLQRASILLDLKVLEPLEGQFHFVIINVLLAFRTEFRSDRIQVRLETGESLLRLITAGRGSIRVT